VKQDEGRWTDNEQEILGGKSVIYTTRNSGGNYYIRIRIPSEGKYIRKSLKTRDPQTAVLRAEEMTLKILADVQGGKKIFGITLRELVHKYLDYRMDDIYVASAETEMTGITKGRWGTIKTHLNNFLKIKSPSLKVGELDEMSVYEYFKERRSLAKNITVSTVRNEQSSINAMMKWAFLNQYTNFEKFRFREISIKGGSRDERRRDTFSPDEYRHLIRVMRAWVRASEEEGGRKYYERRLVQLCVLIGANTMLRVGELWLLKWGDIKKLTKQTTEKGRDMTLARLRVRGETSKVRRDREIVVRGGDYLKQLRKISPFTSKADYVFSDYEKQERFPRERFYALWGELMLEAGFRNYSERKLTWYSLRHFGITYRLRAEVDIATLAEITGTSIQQIERHYGHIDRGMMDRAMLKDAVYVPKEIEEADWED
jgi:integrase